MERPAQALLVLLVGGVLTGCDFTDSSGPGYGPPQQVTVTYRIGGRTGDYLHLAYVIDDNVRHESVSRSALPWEVSLRSPASKPVGIWVEKGAPSDSVHVTVNLEGTEWLRGCSSETRGNVVEVNGIVPQ